VVGGRWEVGGGRWEVVYGRWEMVDGRWGVVVSFYPALAEGRGTLVPIYGLKP